MAFDIHQIPAMVGVLGFLVFIHELGHFLAAKYFKVRVETFSLGFGPRLFGVIRGGTDYCVRLLPLGGYVKMAGEYPQDGVTGDPAELFSKPRWQRFIIALAGPVMNIVCALVLTTGLYWHGAEINPYAYKPTLVGAVAEDSPAAKAGIKPGDLIVQLDELKNPLWKDTSYKEALNAGVPLPATVQRGDQTLHITVTPEPVGVEKTGWVGWDPGQTLAITSIEPDMPAAKSGLMVGDFVVSVDGTPLYSAPQLLSRLAKTKDAPVKLAVTRGAQSLSFDIRPRIDQAQDMYRIGIGFAIPRLKIALPLGEAWARSVDENKENAMLLGKVLHGLFQGRVSYRQMSGPLGIMKMTGEAAQAGATPLVGVAASLSLNLGLFNLLPFPVLDGGMILFLLIEAIRRKDVSLRVKERIYTAAALVLVAFAVLITSSDLLKMWHR